MSGDSKLLPEREKNELQTWLDRRERGLEPPLDDGRPGSKDRAQLLVADYYVIATSNWAIEKVTPLLGESGFEPQAEGLLRLCAGHREGLAEALDSDLDPTFLERGEVVIHYRFLSCLLRVADVLDLDPERIPDVLTHSRNGSLSSALAWRRNPHLDLTAEGTAVLWPPAGPGPRRNRTDRANDRWDRAQLRPAADIDAVSLSR